MLRLVVKCWFRFLFSRITKYDTWRVCTLLPVSLRLVNLQIQKYQMFNVQRHFKVCGSVVGQLCCSLGVVVPSSSTSGNCKVYWHTLLIVIVSLPWVKEINRSHFNSVFLPTRIRPRRYVAMIICEARVHVHAIRTLHVICQHYYNVYWTDRATVEEQMGPQFRCVFDYYSTILLDLPSRSCVVRSAEQPSWNSKSINLSDMSVLVTIDLNLFYE